MSVCIYIFVQVHVRRRGAVERYAYDMYINTLSVGRFRLRALAAVDAELSRGYKFARIALGGGGGFPLTTHFANLIRIHIYIVCVCECARACI